MTGYRARVVSKNGKRPIVFSAAAGFVDQPVTIACGQCIGCRLDRSQQWATRCVNEASLFLRNCFITLTYRDECLPGGASLTVKHFQDFMKRFRKHHQGFEKVWNEEKEKFENPIRFFHCGEYGKPSKDNHFIARPHYHAAIFNFDFEDRIYWKKSPSGIPVFLSDTLSDLWPYGHSAVGDLNYESAAYIARYVVDKINGDEAPEHYGDRKPEYVTMSRRPGIGARWYAKYKKDVFPSDVFHLSGRAVKPPKYYVGKLELEDKRTFDQIKAERLKTMLLFKKDNTYERLRVRKIVKLASINLLKRNHEDL
jgi:hypothetical protein